MNIELTVHNFLGRRKKAMFFSKVSGDGPSLVSLTFDDCPRSQFEVALPMLDDYGMPATFYPISQYLFRDWHEYMGLSELGVIKEIGHEIGAHTRFHNDLTQLSESEARSELTDNRSEMEKWGLEVTTLAYPYGKRNKGTMEAAAQAGFIAGRSIRRGNNNQSADPLDLRANGVNIKGVGNSVHAVKKAEKLTNKLLSGSGSWTIFVFHQIEPMATLKNRMWTSGTTPEAFEAVLRLIKKSGVEVVTVADGARRLHRQIMAA